MKGLARSVYYTQCDWKKCGDLKVVAVVIKNANGIRKIWLLLCKRGSRAKLEHYIAKSWPNRQMVLRENILHKTLSMLE